jgi:hypothetical protein
MVAGQPRARWIQTPAGDADEAARPQPALESGPPHPRADRIVGVEFLIEVARDAEFQAHLREGASENQGAPLRGC